MNIAFFVKPKSMLTCLRPDTSLAGCIARFGQAEGDALPVIDREGSYLGRLTRETLLCSLAEGLPTEADLRRLKVTDLSLEEDAPLPVTAPMEDLLAAAEGRSFVPITDDLGHFIGIVDCGRLSAELSRTAEH